MTRGDPPYSRQPYRGIAKGALASCIQECAYFKKSRKPGLCCTAMAVQAQMHLPDGG